MEQALQQLIDFVKDSAPAVWEMAVRQVYYTAYLDLVWGLAFLVASISLWSFTKRKWEAWSGEGWRNDEVAKGFSIAGIVCLLFGALAEFSCTFGYFYNPYWWAIKMLLSTATGK